MCVCMYYNVHDFARLSHAFTYVTQTLESVSTVYVLKWLYTSMEVFAILTVGPQHIEEYILISPGNPVCANGGSCYDGTCSCSPGYGGSRCEIRELCYTIHLEKQSRPQKFLLNKNETYI